MENKFTKEELLAIINAIEKHIDSEIAELYNRCTKIGQQIQFNGCYKDYDIGVANSIRYLNGQLDLKDRVDDVLMDLCIEISDRKDGE